MTISEQICQAEMKVATMKFARATNKMDGHPNILPWPCVDEAAAFASRGGLASSWPAGMSWASGRADTEPWSVAHPGRDVMDMKASLHRLEFFGCDQR